MQAPLLKDFKRFHLFNRELIQKVLNYAPKEAGMEEEKGMTWNGFVYNVLPTVLVLGIPSAIGLLVSILLSTGQNHNELQALKGQLTERTAAIQTLNTKLENLIISNARLEARLTIMEVRDQK